MVSRFLCIKGLLVVLISMRGIEICNKEIK